MFKSCARMGSNLRHRSDSCHARAWKESDALFLTGKPQSFGIFCHKAKMARRRTTEASTFSRATSPSRVGVEIEITPQPQASANFNTAKTKRSVNMRDPPSLSSTNRGAESWRNCKRT